VIGEMKMKNHCFYLKKGLLLLSVYALCGIFAGAYIDPATTSYIIQIVVGVLIAAGTTIGIFWNKISRLFKKNSTDKSPVQHNKKTHKGVITAEELMQDDEQK
jgi:hypothetical protein